MPYPAFTSLLHLTEAARSVLPRDADIQAWNQGHGQAKRSYARWLLPERQLVQALTAHGSHPRQIAGVVQRTEYAVQLQLDRRGHTTGQEEADPPVQRSVPDLKGFPASPLRLCDEDVELLTQWPGEPLRDPLGWLPAGSLPQSLWQPAAQPTLRVLLVGLDETLGIRRVEPGEPRYWPLTHADLEMAAQGTWTDLAAQLVQQGGQVLLPPEDILHSQRKALRSTITRTVGEAPARNRVVDMVAAADPTRQADVALIYHPATWKGLRRNVTASTVILVLPQLPSPEQLRRQTPQGVLPRVTPDLAEQSSLPVSLRYGDEIPQDWIRQALLAWHAQQAVIDRWLVGRTLETYSRQGVSHTSGIPARLDWVVLRLLPDQGWVMAPADDLLLRAAVWYQLASGRQVSLPEEVLSKVAEVADLVRQVPPDSAPRHLAQQLKGRPLHDRVMARVWLDTLFALPELPSGLEQARLQFVVVDSLSAMTYIGR